MIYRGHVKNGVVVLDDDASLPDGMEVSIQPIATPSADPGIEDAPTLYERLKPFIGSATGLPPDASQRIDDFLYGQAES